MTSSVCSNSTEELKMVSSVLNEEENEANQAEISGENEAGSDLQSKELDESNNPVEILKKFEILKELK